MSFESYYTKNPILAKSQARKLYRHLKAATIKILQKEAKHANGRDKVIGKRYIRILKENL